jgi:hypothetical protein
MTGLGTAVLLLATVTIGETPEERRQIDEQLPAARTAVSKLRGAEPPSFAIEIVARSQPSGFLRDSWFAPYGQERGRDALARKAKAWVFLGLLPPGTDLAADLDALATVPFERETDSGRKTISVVSEATLAGRTRRREAIQNVIGETRDLEGIRRLNREWMALADADALEATHEYSLLRGALIRGLYLASFDARHPTLARGESSDADLAYAAVRAGAARLAAIEAQLGEAKTEACLATFGKTFDALALRDDGNRPARFVRQALNFPHIEGARFVAELKKAREGKWADIEASRDRWPTTTHAILHPKEYASKSARYLNVRLPELDRTEGRKWEPIWNDSLGAFGIGYLLRGIYEGDKARGVLNGVDADRVADGWRGDRYQLLADGRDRFVFAWTTTWRDATAARAFADAYAKRLGWKYPGAAVLRSTADRYSIQRDVRISFVVRGGPLGTEVVVGEEIPAESAEAIERLLLGADLSPLRGSDPTPGSFHCPVHLNWSNPHQGCCPLCGRPRLQKEEGKKEEKK